MPGRRNLLRCNQASAVAAVGCLLCVALVAGCGQKQLDKTVKSWFNRKPPGQQMFVALQEEDPDLRRQAVLVIAKSDSSAQQWAIKALDTIARTDPNSQVRCAAIRGLGRSGLPEAVQPLLMILNWSDYPDEVLYPPDHDVRWDAVAVLSSLCGWGLVPDQQLPQVRQTLLRLLRGDDSRNVRLEAARGLACFGRDRHVLDALIAALNDPDFAVVYQAEQSLMSLTGMTLDHDSAAWLAWRDKQEDPFARAGQVPESLQPQQRAWWTKSLAAVRRVVILWQGERKEQ